MSSLVAITSAILQVPSRTRICALFVQTSVPWLRPEILIKSEKSCGCVSTSIFRTKSVPNSGIPNVETSEPSSSFVKPSGSVDTNIFKISGSSSFIESLLTPVKSSSILIMVGPSCPRISSFKMFEWSALYAKCVVKTPVDASSAGYCIGEKSWMSLFFGTIIIPPGCCPVVLLMPTMPFISRFISASETTSPCSSK